MKCANLTNGLLLPMWGRICQVNHCSIVDQDKIMSVVSASVTVSVSVGLFLLAGGLIYWKFFSEPEVPHYYYPPPQGHIITTLKD